MLIVDVTAAAAAAAVAVRQLQAHADALFRRHVAGVRAGMRKAFAAVVAAERLLAGMDAHMLLEVVLELERLVAVGALEFAQQRRLVVADHVALQAVHVGKRFVAHLAALWVGRNLGGRGEEITGQYGMVIA